jgi:ATP-binding cassette subfamily A (ABC1) protein 3
MNAAILRLATGDQNMTIQTRNHPLPMTKSQHLQHHVCFLSHARCFQAF